MKPALTRFTQTIFRLPGGTHENDLPVEVTTSEQGPCMRSVWQPTADERARITAGENVYLVVWGTQHPAVAVGVSSDSVVR